MKKTVKPGMRRTVMRRVGQVIAAMAVVAGLSLATGGTATAAGLGELACHYEVNRFNTCLAIYFLGSDQYAVHVGIDVNMSQRAAQDIIDAEGQEFSGSLYGDDGQGSGEFLFDLPITRVSAWSGGLSAEFDTIVPRSWLNEDSGTAVDELIARIRLWLPSAQSYAHYRSGQVTGRF